MRLNEAMIEYLGETIAKRLIYNRETGIPEDELDKIKKIIIKTIKEDIEREKKIEEEAHKLLKQHIREIEEQGISYSKMFQIVKQKLAKERGVIL